MTNTAKNDPTDPTVEEQITQFELRGFSRNHLTVSDSGRVFFDPEKCDLEVHLRVFGSDAQPSAEQPVR